MNGFHGSLLELICLSLVVVELWLSHFSCALLIISIGVNFPLSASIAFCFGLSSAIYRVRFTIYCECRLYIIAVSVCVDILINRTIERWNCVVVKATTQTHVFNTQYEYWLKRDRIKDKDKRKKCNGQWKSMSPILLTPIEDINWRVRCSLSFSLPLLSFSRSNRTQMLCILAMQHLWIFYYIHTPNK